MPDARDQNPVSAVTSNPGTRRRRIGWLVRAVLLVTGVSMLVFGFWAWLSPGSFAEFTAFPVHVHYLHDAGVFQIGIGVSLLAALVIDDAVIVALTGFFIANTLHTINHALDLQLGGHVGDIFGLGTLSLLAGAAIAWRIRHRTSTEGARQ
jgi:hypothetical protein